METFESILSAGGHKNSLGRSGEIYEIVKADPGRTQELFDCIYADDAWVRMRAIDTFEKLVRDNPALAKPYTAKLVDELTASDQASIQWHLAQMFAVIELDQAQSYKVLSWLKDRISTVDVDWIVSVDVMKTLLYFYGMNLVDYEELRSLVEIQKQHKSKSVRRKAEQILSSLN